MIINKLTIIFSGQFVCLLFNSISYCFTLFICGGPCHLSSFRQCSGGPYFPLRTAGLWKNLFIILNPSTFIVSKTT